MPSLYLVRHCQSTGQQPDGALTDEGNVQAVELMARLQALQPDALFSSPYRRAVDTIRPFAELAKMEITINDGLKERLLKPIGEVRPDWLEHVRKSFDDRDYYLQGGESLNQTCERAMQALMQIVDLGHKRPVVATHGNLIASVLGLSEPNFGFDDWRNMKNPHIYRLHFHRNGISRFEDLG